MISSKSLPGENEQGDLSGKNYRTTDFGRLNTGLLMTSGVLSMKYESSWEAVPRLIMIANGLVAPLVFSMLAVLDGWKMPRRLTRQRPWTYYFAIGWAVLASSYSILWCIRLLIANQNSTLGVFCLLFTLSLTVANCNFLWLWGQFRRTRSPEQNAEEAARAQC
jgi:hypothetical protein